MFPNCLVRRRYFKIYRQLRFYRLLLFEIELTWSVPAINSAMPLLTKYIVRDFIENYLPSLSFPNLIVGLKLGDDLVAANFRSYNIILFLLYLDALHSGKKSPWQMFSILYASFRLHLTCLAHFERWNPRVPHVLSLRNRFEQTLLWHCFRVLFLLLLVLDLCIEVDCWNECDVFVLKSAWDVGIWVRSCTADDVDWTEKLASSVITAAFRGLLFFVLKLFIFNLRVILIMLEATALKNDLNIISLYKRWYGWWGRGWLVTTPALFDCLEFVDVSVDITLLLRNIGSCWIFRLVLFGCLSIA